MSDIILNTVVYIIAVLIMFTWLIIKGDHDDD